MGNDTTCLEAIKKVFANEKGVLSTREVIDRIYKLYPSRHWKENTISAHLIALSFNHPSSYHYGSTRQHAFLFSLGRGNYRLWDHAKDGAPPSTIAATTDKRSLKKRAKARPADAPGGEKDRGSIERIFTVASFLDAARWEDQRNYNLINFHSNKISDDAKILTHWLCYITDRQTEFARIWDVAGFIFSELVDEIAVKRSLDLLNPNSADSFFVRRGNYHYKDMFFDSSEHDKYLFVSHQKVGENPILPDYDFEKDMSPYFISRFYPSDYMAILYTLHALQHYDYSLAQFIGTFLESQSGDESLIAKLLYALYLLTYEGVGQPKQTDIDFPKNMRDAARRTKRLQEILADKKRFQAAFETFSEDLIFRQKRAWCSLRDFLKSPEFGKYFLGALKTRGYTELDALSSDKALTQLELHGDVWNNNPKFRHCILKNTGYAHRRDYFPELIRELFDNISPASGYPEQFDVTFDFVPRMCDKNNCAICIYGTFVGKGKDFYRVCVRDETKYCPVTLVSCNYKILCKGEACSLHKLIPALVSDFTCVRNASNAKS